MKVCQALKNEGGKRMYRLTDVDTEKSYPEIANKDLSVEELKEFFLDNESCKNDYNGDFDAWFSDAIKNGFFKEV